MLFGLIIVRSPRTNILTAFVDVEETFIGLLVDLFGFHVCWTMFTSGPDKNFWDIKITALTDKKKHIWFICRDKKIGNFVVHSHNSRISLADVYEECAEYFNKFYFKQVQEYLDEKGEKLLKFSIQQTTHNAFVSNKKIQERKQYNVEDTFFRWSITDQKK
jgi:hypothetical protein